MRAHRQCREVALEILGEFQGAGIAPFGLRASATRRMSSITAQLPAQGLAGRLRRRLRRIGRRGSRAEQQLEQQHAERVDVDGGRDRVAASCSGAA